MGGDLKKADLLAALAGIDAAAEQVVTQADTRGETLWIVKTLDSARFFSEPVRLAVDRRREETGDATHESLLHESARRLHAEFTAQDEPSWEVKGWREIERLETGERVFEVKLLGVALPAEGEELIPVKRRSDEHFTPLIRTETPMFNVSDVRAIQSPEDFCECAHTRGSHYAEPLIGGEIRDYGECGMEGCSCKKFRLLAAGVEGVEESPPDPHPDLTMPSADEEGAAITFLRQFTGSAGLDAPDPEGWMALQRLLSAGWRIVPPPDA